MQVYYKNRNIIFWGVSNDDVTLQLINITQTSSYVFITTLLLVHTFVAFMSFLYALFFPL